MSVREIKLVALPLQRLRVRIFNPHAFTIVIGGKVSKGEEYITTVAQCESGILFFYVLTDGELEKIQIPVDSLFLPAASEHISKLSVKLHGKIRLLFMVEDHNNIFLTLDLNAEAGVLMR
jgi:hypothetical protein